MRSPICAFLGHVDAGKTSIIDAIRDTFFAYRETGGLTQNIGTTEVPTPRKALKMAIAVSDFISIISF